ncbi:ankyrin repeat domain-containing protein [Marinobacter sp. NFXS9]|uniref:ankyrin repeat domain-containing protein n=1 Tax=Marinobacter sp. NFXS9 TaxID=2818433 RepID=UPI0032DF0323
MRVAVYRNFDKVAERLLSLGADPNLVLKNTCSPLGTAIINTNESIIRLLLKHEADTRNPVCWSSNQRQIPIDQSIIQHDLSNDVRIEIMQRHVQQGSGLSPSILVFAIVNDNYAIAKAFVNLMPSYRNKTFIALAKPRSNKIYNLLTESWNDI